MRVLGVITARGGSKGIPRKNIRPLAGKPLLAWTAEEAIAAKGLSRTILSTDDEEIAACGRAAGLDVPFMRPTDLAQDRTPTLPVLQHAVAVVEAAGEHYDAICLLQPTNPFRGADVIDACIAKFQQTGADSLITVLPVPLEYNPHWVYFEQPDGAFVLSTGEAAPIPRRQDLPPAFHREGSVYLMTRDVLMGGSLYGLRVVGFPMDPANCVNIDDETDWARAEALAHSR